MRDARKSLSMTSSASSMIAAAWQRIAPSSAAAAAAAAGRAGTPPSDGGASTSYPSHSWRDGGDDGAGGGLSATVMSAREAETALDFVLEGSAKSAGVLFLRYDMDLDGFLRQQDLYGEPSARAARGDSSVDRSCGVTLRVLLRGMLPAHKQACRLSVFALTANSMSPPDLLLELNLALPYEDYQRLIDFLFAAAGEGEERG
jgi:hypothetical protein